MDFVQLVESGIFVVVQGLHFTRGVCYYSSDASASCAGSAALTADSAPVSADAAADPGFGGSTSSNRAAAVSLPPDILVLGRSLSFLFLEYLCSMRLILITRVLLYLSV